MELNDKKIQILETAEKLFAEQGFSGTSIRDIAKAAGINIAMISYYFGSKDKLLETLFVYRTTDFRMELETVLSTDDDYFTKVDKMVSMVVKRIHQNRRIHKIIHFEAAKGRKKADFKAYLKGKKENHAIIEKFISEGQEAGVFSRSVNIPLIAPTILGTYFNFYYNKQFFETIYNTDKNTTLDEYIHGPLTTHLQITIKALLKYDINYSN